MKISLKCFFAVCSSFLLLSSCQKSINSKNGFIKISIVNMVDAAPMSLNAPAYKNPFGETYTITRFKYYISNLRLTSTGASAIEKESYHLVDQSLPGSLSFGFETGENTFSGMSFLIGVDSIRNVSGAQTGALDPLKDMFWTWNSGYIMAKMEGTSPQSNQAGNKIEYHIGGFSGINSVLRTVTLAFPSGKMVEIKPGQTSEIRMEADFNKWWQAPNDIKITDLPVCTTPGAMAKKIADNYSKMFIVTDVLNN